MPRTVAKIPTLIYIFLLGIGLVVLGVPEVEAQSRGGQQAPTQRQAAPGQSRAPAGSHTPPATRPSNPESSFDQSPRGGRSTTGQAQANDPGTPPSPSQTPLGGTEWLAAAGAAYALNRLRKEGGEPDDEESDDMS